MLNHFISHSKVDRRQYYLIATLLAAVLLVGCGGVRPKPAIESALVTALPPTAAPTFAPTASPQPTVSPTPPASAVCSPLMGHRVVDLLTLYLTQDFIPPVGDNKETGHHGLDFAYYSGGPTGGHIDGTPITSVLNASVAGVGYNAVYGYYLIIETPLHALPPALAELYQVQADQSLYVLYGHMQLEAPFALGQPLECGELVGHVGESGSRLFLTDPHLHIETRVGRSGLQLNAMAYYLADTTEDERQEYLRWRTSQDFRLENPTLLLNYAITQP